MNETSGGPGTFAMDREGFDALLALLDERGYRIMGPTVREGAIVYDRVRSSADLPEGWTDEQEGGTYRLKPREDRALFGYTVSPQSWKRFLHPPKVRLWTAHRTEKGFVPEPEPASPPRYAFLGVRACELAAIRIQDRIFLGGDQVDRTYRTNREDLLVIAVHCTRAGNTCFCASMGTGPRAGEGFDLALTELVDGESSRFVVEVGTSRGRRLVEALELPPADAPSREEASRRVDEAAGEMGRSLDTEGIQFLLQRNLESPVWEQVAERCLACGNCTMVCPTCFCTTVEDVTDLTGSKAERWRRWDSCYTVDFSYIHGGSVRTSGRARYRQWLTHKLSSWYEQFDTSGCTGCGRCITWCPVGIDLTEEVNAIRATEAAASGARGKGGNLHGHHQDARTDPGRIAVPQGAED